MFGVTVKGAFYGSPSEKGSKNISVVNKTFANVCKSVFEKSAKL